MTILYLTEHSPLAHGCGGATRSRALWRALRELGDVTTVVFDGGNPRRDPADAGLAISHLRLPDFWRGWSRREPVWLWGLLAGRIDRAFAGRDEILRGLGLADAHFDAVVVRYYWILARTAAWKVAPCFLDFDDLPADYHAATDWRDLSGLAILREKLRVRLRQAVLVRRCRAVWLANAGQCARLRCQGRLAQALPNIAEGPSAEPAAGRAEGNYLLSVGAMGYRPNVEGLLWFLSNVWPAVRARHPSLVFKLVGKDFDDALRARCASVHGVEVAGFVESLDDVYASCLGLVAPLFSGGGTCIKVLEAQLHGVKVFATPVAARGFSPDELAASGTAVFETADGFVRQISDWLSRTPDDRQAARRQIRAFARERNSFARFAETVRNTILKEVECPGR